MRGKVRILCLAILLVAMAGAAQADTIFPVGSTLNYSATDGSKSWTSTLAINNDGTIMQMNNWDYDEYGPAPVELTSTTFSIDEGKGYQLYFTTLKNSWEITSDDGAKGTATLKGITDVTVSAGTFHNVYWVYYKTEDKNGGVHMNEDMYWLPGLGLIKAVDRGYNPTQTHELTSYATPIPPGVLLLGSGLVGLLGLRGFRRS
jgi:hypothetical protein